MTPILSDLIKVFQITLNKARLTQTENCEPFIGRNLEEHFLYSIVHKNQESELNNCTWSDQHFLLFVENPASAMKAAVSRVPL